MKINNLKNVVNNMKFIKFNDLNFLTISTVIKSKKIDVPLGFYIKKAIQNYFINNLKKNHVPLFKVILFIVEKSLLDVVMQHTRGNQTQAALILGINRGTLRKKLKKCYAK